jgi:hypothetical protein
MLCHLVWIPLQCGSHERTPKDLLLFEDSSNGVSISDMLKFDKECEIVVPTALLMETLVFLGYEDL